MMHIDDFKKEYAAKVYEIEKVCFHNPWSLADIEAQADNPTSHFAVAVVDGKVVGYMGLQIFSGEGYVTNVAVLPEYRRQGIAEALIEYQFNNDMEFITLEVRASNAPAINLYTKKGFLNVGTRPAFYSNPPEDAVIMTKNMR